MRILVALTYYRPHISGLTIYAERLARALAERGHQVTVLTSQYDKALPLEETQDGVRVVRVPVLFRVSKGVIMPTIGLEATKLVLQNDVLSLHLPQFDAAGLAFRSRLLNRPTVLTYHCDLQLPPGIFNRLADQVVHLANLAAGALAESIVISTEDYIGPSSLLQRFRPKITIIPPPVIMPAPVPGDVTDFATRHGLDDRVVIGMATRFAAEKGVEYLLEALPELIEQFPTLVVLFVGPYQNIVGEDAYLRRLWPMIQQCGNHWDFLGTLPSKEMPSFFANCDCLVVPSVNSTESFGMVQVEAMLCGTPVVASNLPGVRQPVGMTGMGQVVAVADARALAQGIAQVLRNRGNYVRPREAIESLFAIEDTVKKYEKLFLDLRSSHAG